MKTSGSLLCTVLAVLVSSAAVAADQTEKAKAPGKKGRQRAPKVTARFLDGIELTAEQKAQIAAIDREFAAKTADLRKQMAGVLTEDQRRARAQARKAAREAGQKGAQAAKAVASSAKLTDEQKAKLASIQKANRQLSQQVIAALKKVLTDEQFAKLKKPASRRTGAKKRGGKKKRGAGKPAGRRKTDAENT